MTQVSTMTEYTLARCDGTKRDDLVAMLERDGFHVLSLESEYGDAFCRWTANVVTPDKFQIHITGRRLISQCCLNGLILRQSQDDQWDGIAAPAKQPIKPEKKKAAVEPAREQQLTDLAIQWGPSSAADRARHSISHLQCWGIITPDEATCFSNRLAQAEKGSE